MNYKTKNKVSYTERGFENIWCSQRNYTVNRNAVTANWKLFIPLVRHSNVIETDQSEKLLKIYSEWIVSSGLKWFLWFAVILVCTSLAGSEKCNCKNGYETQDAKS